MIVDDSAVARAVLARMIASQPDFEIAATVSSADAALAFLAGRNVDIILLDIEMPGMDGLTALPALLAASGGARVLIVSSACDEGASATMQALTLGAADTLAKPVRSAFGGHFAEALFEKLARIGHARMAPHPSARGGKKVAVPSIALRQLALGPVECLAIGASTGGLHALSNLLRALPASFDAPILITQHLPPIFMPFFASQICEVSGRPTKVAQNGALLERGHILVAPGEGHLCCKPVRGRVVATIIPDPVENGCMPSVDPMLASVSDVFGVAAVGIILSGMGRDGVLGAAVLARAGGDLLVQDRESSVVWGMPGAIVSAGLASVILPPDQIAERIRQRHKAAL